MYNFPSIDQFDENTWVFEYNNQLYWLDKLDGVYHLRNTELTFLDRLEIIAWLLREK